MKVYRINGEKGPHRMAVTPGYYHKNVTDWFHLDGTTPICFIVVFNEGMAEVQDNLGKYLLDEKLVQRSPLILKEEDDQLLDFSDKQYANS